MASLSNDGGLRRILVTTPRGKREAIRLGRMPLKQARGILRHVENLAAAAIDGSAPHEETSHWLARLEPKLRDRLAELQLAAPREAKPEPTIAELVDMFKSRPKWRELAPRTRDNYGEALARLVAHNGQVKARNFTDADAEDFRAYLTERKPLGAGLSRATANQAAGTASILFRFACKSRLVDRNPFEGVERGSVSTQRKAFVEAAAVHTLIDGLNSTEWRLLVALARWGGLRTPSEPTALKWGHIDREHGRITIPQVKTAERVIPLFPELERYIQERYDEAEPGEEFVLPMLQRLGRAACGSKLTYAFKRLQMDRWPRAFHNLRSSRQTELEQQFPGYVVAYWLGNSVEVARKHYLQVLDGHYEAAQKAAQTVTAKPSQDATSQQSGAVDMLDSRSVADGVASVRGSV